MAITVHCERCGHRFEAPEERAGSIQRCPACGGATAVPGSHDPLWAAVRAAAALGAVAVAAAAWWAAGPLAGVGSLALAAALLWLASLAL